MKMRKTRFGVSTGRSRAVHLIRAFVVTAIVAITIGFRVEARTDDTPWSTPENLSHSGAASAPTLLTQAAGQVRVVWWDAFEGLTFVEGTAGDWSDPVMAESDEDEEPQALTNVPQIVGDSSGTAHAFWIAEPDQDSPATPLLFSQLPAGRSVWTEPRVMVRSAAGFSITTDSDDNLYLAYSRNLHRDDSPSALVFRLSTNGGATWQPQLMIDTSLYYRSATDERLALRLTADADGLVILTWNDPQRQQSMLATSPDGGETWIDPVAVTTAAGSATNAHVFIPREGQVDEALLLWQGTDSFGGCAQYQAPVAEIIEGDAVVGRRVLERLSDCATLQAEQLPLADAEEVMIVTGGGTDSLALYLWNGEAWSEPVHLAFRFPDPSSGAPVHLSALRGARLPAESDEDEEAALAVVGVDDEGDVWFTQSEISALSILYAPPSPWSAPSAVAPSPLLPDLPGLIADEEGVIHALWAEPETSRDSTRVLRHARWSGTAWTRGATVIRSAAGSTSDPAITRIEDRIHAVWSDGPDGQILYSSAFLRDAHTVGGWDEPRSLPGPTRDTGVGSSPQIVAVGGEGRLHAIYAVPVNEQRGVYYTNSDDHGAGWSEAVQVFDAARAGWVAVDTPRLAVDVLGHLHAVWIHASLSADTPSMGIYYAFSNDGGASWSEPFLAAQGNYIHPNVVTDGLGGVHLFWNLASGESSWWHQWSAGTAAMPAEESDITATWTRPTRIPGFTNIDGPVAMGADGALGLQLVGLGIDSAGEAALFYQTWSTSYPTEPDDGEVAVQNGRWGTVETARLDPAPLYGGVSALLQPDHGRLDLLYRATDTLATHQSNPDLWHSGREVPVTTLDPDVWPIEGSRLAVALASMPAGSEPGSGASEGVGAADDVDAADSAGASDGVGAARLPTAERDAGPELSLMVSGALAVLVVVGVLGVRSLAKSNR